jgi:hypothetical protein
MSAVLTSSELNLSPAELAAVNGLRLGIGLPFSYKGPTCQTACHLVIARQQGEIVVLLSDRNAGEASSITHSFPKVATVVYQQFLHDVDHRAIHWLEHAPSLAGQATDERFERVRLLWNPDLHRFTHALRSGVHVP